MPYEEFLDFRHELHQLHPEDGGKTSCELIEMSLDREI